MSRFETAVHEAAHCVVARALGFRPHWARIEDGDSGATMIDFSPGSAARRPASRDPDAPRTEGGFRADVLPELGDAQRMDIAATLIAGRVAQVRAGMHPVIALACATDDLAMEQEVFDLMKEGPRWTVEDRTYRRAKALVGSEWPAIAYVAAAILARDDGRLEGAPLDEALAGPSGAKSTGNGGR
jgi:hypothetical protein